MIVIVSSGGVCASVEILTSLAEFGSRYHSRIHNHKQRAPITQTKKNENNKQ